jgi:pimeloyl-ACP methyl ester carboxylesterase
VRTWGGAAGTGTGTGTVVVALHGLTSTGDVWDGLADAVVRAAPGTAVVAPDLPGRGRSVAVPAAPGLAGLAERVVAAVEDLGPSRVVLVGHSMGAFLAPLVAARLGGRAAGVVLLDGGAAPEPSPLVRPLVVRALFTVAVRRLAGTWPDVEAAVRATDGRAVAVRTDLRPAVRAWTEAALTGPPGALRLPLDRRRLVADAVDTLSGPSTLPVLAPGDVPVHLLAATRGADDGRDPFLSDAALAAARDGLPRLTTGRVVANHVTLLLDPAPVAAVLRVLAGG